MQEIENNQEIDYGINEGAVRGAIQDEIILDIDLKGLPIETLVDNIDTIAAESNDAYALLRKQSIGASDSSIVMGVNPYKTQAELIAEKSRDYLTAEELEVGQKVAVRKGRDLEPLIIEKHSKYFATKVFKPKDMYKFKEYPWQTLNFDGVTLVGQQYIPVEIKVCTIAGERHYNKSKALFSDVDMVFKPKPEDYTEEIYNTIQTKAAQYGIPPYYYTQLQVQMAALNAPFGMLSILMEKDWSFHSFYVHRDYKFWSDYVVESYQVAKQCKNIVESGVFGKNDAPESSTIDVSDTGNMITL